MGAGARPRRLWPEKSGVVNRPARDRADVPRPAAHVRAGARFQPEVEVEAGAGDDGVRHALEKARPLSVKLDGPAAGTCPSRSGKSPMSAPLAVLAADGTFEYDAT
jgi:hypothetical protein